ncbi:MAG: hypothetical protein NC489_42740 [Ruminococcus flavefaciens]|nr:hypothetical protein [Clostridium sp.]MCM1236841.1 hypothetical protein [Ruminococcus flavefaciens]
MDFGVTGKLWQYGINNRATTMAERDVDGSFAEIAAAKVAEKESATGMSFKDMWQARFPGAYYHSVDASDIPQGVWDRNDFPMEKFFQDNVDESVLDWKPTGAMPSATNSQVQSRWNSVAGEKSIIVPPELEEKMKNDPKLARRVMANVESFITTYSATSVRQGRVCSWLISLDENGEIEKYRVTGSGGNISGPTEAEQRQFEAEQAAKRKRREKYAKLNEESALKRKMLEQETDERYYKNSITKQIALSAYEKSIMEL